jgi:hypothetical protein
MNILPNSMMFRYKYNNNQEEEEDVHVLLNTQSVQRLIDVWPHVHQVLGLDHVITSVDDSDQHDPFTVQLDYNFCPDTCVSSTLTLEAKRGWGLSLIEVIRDTLRNVDIYNESVELSTEECHRFEAVLPHISSIFNPPHPLPSNDDDDSSSHDYDSSDDYDSDQILARNHRLLRRACRRQQQHLNG